MGLTDFFRSLFSPKPPAVRRDDQIWLSQGAKLRGIVRDVAKALREKATPLVVAHFPNMFRGMRSLLEGTQTPFAVLGESESPRSWMDGLLHADPKDVLLSESKDVPEFDPTSFQQRDDAKAVSIIVIESHPLPARDAAIEHFAVQLPSPCQLQVHLSLEDAVMRAFAGEWVADMLRKLGMTEDEPIQSRMVMRQIRAAQRKIEGRAVGNEPADSAEEWLRLNCPEFSPKS